jgi:hypothetical protein
MFLVAFAPAQNAARQSMLSWLVQALGVGGLLTGLTALLIFVGAWLVVRRAQRPEVIASYAAFVPVPLMLAFFISLKGTVASMAVLASADIQLKQSEVAEGIGVALVTPLFALLLMFPSYLVLAGGWLARLLRSDPPAGDPHTIPLPHLPGKVA